MMLHHLILKRIFRPSNIVNDKSLQRVAGTGHNAGRLVSVGDGFIEGYSVRIFNSIHKRTCSEGEFTRIYACYFIKDTLLAFVYKLYVSCFVPSSLPSPDGPHRASFVQTVLSYVFAGHQII